MKRILLLSLILMTCFMTMPAKADVIWPALYVWVGGTTPMVILLGLLTEILIIKYFAKLSWLKASIVGVLMNLLTAAIGFGIFYITRFGLFVDVLVIGLSGVHGIRMEFWICMLAWYIIFVLINSLVEWVFVSCVLRKNFLKILAWMFCANALSILYVFIYLFIFGDSIHF